MFYREKSNELIEWKILSDGEHLIDTDYFMPPSSSANIVSSESDFDASIAENFFKHAFPSITGHAQIINMILFDLWVPFYEMTQSNKIQFHDLNEPDPD